MSNIRRLISQPDESAGTGNCLRLPLGEDTVENLLDYSSWWEYLKITELSNQIVARGATSNNKAQVESFRYESKGAGQYRLWAIVSKPNIVGAWVEGEVFEFMEPPFNTLPLINPTGGPDPTIEGVGDIPPGGIGCDPGYNTFNPTGDGKFFKPEEVLTQRLLRYQLLPTAGKTLQRPEDKDGFMIQVRTGRQYRIQSSFDEDGTGQPYIVLEAVDGLPSQFTSVEPFTYEKGGAQVLYTTMDVNDYEETDTLEQSAWPVIPAPPTPGIDF